MKRRGQRLLSTLNRRHLWILSLWAITFACVCDGSASAENVVNPAQPPQSTPAQSPYRAQYANSNTIVAIHTRSSIYWIPRNYIKYPDPSYPILAVTFPGFVPFSDNNRKCFEGRVVGCTPVELRLHGGDGPAPGGRAFTTREMLHNFITGIKVSKSYNSIGYTIYSVGPPNAETKIYTKPSSHGMTFVACFSDGKILNATCDDTLFLSDGNAIRFFCSESKIGDIQKIETGVRQLFSGFSVPDK